MKGYYLHVHDSFTNAFRRGNHSVDNDSLHTQTITRVVSIELTTEILKLALIKKP